MMMLLHRSSVTSFLKIVQQIRVSSVICGRYYAHTAVPLRPKKPTSSTQKVQKFVDWREIKMVGGKGGDGMAYLLRVWVNDRAGPAGGDGGNGGHVIFQASTNVSSLNHIPALCKGDEGENGKRKDMFGKSAEHTLIKVPIGTIFKDETQKIVADLNREDAMFVAAKGGAGGKGNHFFLSDRLRAPMIYELGAEGEKKTYTVELRLIADIGLIGFPNAGKSTLLRAISRARPKVASYPFTTLNPHIGIVHFDNFEQISVADIPGLIPGAHKNKGLGISFLRHIERCRCLLFVLDLSQAEPWHQLKALQFELEQYQPGLASCPHAIVANKVDLPEAEANLDCLRQMVSMPVIPISAKYGNNISLMLDHLHKLYETGKSETKPEGSVSSPSAS